MAAVAALSIALGACATAVAEVEIIMYPAGLRAPCRDVEVFEIGDEVPLGAGQFRYRLDDRNFEWISASSGSRAEYSWSLIGPGGLDSPGDANPTFIATEPGHAFINLTAQTNDVGLLDSGEGQPVLVRIELRGSCVIRVVEAAEPTTTVPPPVLPPGTLVYEVTSRVVASSLGGVGNEGTAQWTFSFECADGRCDAEVTAGSTGPAPAPTFSAGFSVDRYGFVEAEDAGDCRRRVTGRIDPEEWFVAGPSTFTVSWDSTVTCPGGGESVVEWEGEGQLQRPSP